jgi:tetratricopeptide (TPR) repeat protein
MKNLLLWLLGVCLALPALAQAPAGQPTAPASQPARPAVPPPPQAKTQAEFDAYKAAAAQATPPAMEDAVNKFVAAYPESELRAPLYQRLMERYYFANNPEKTLAAARALLALDPDNPAALVRSATVLAETTAPGDVAGTERLLQAQKDAQHLLNTLDRTFDTLFSPETPPDQMATIRRGVLTLAYSALGKVDLDLKQYPQAEEALRKALELVPKNAQNLYRLALALDHQGRYADALEAVNQSLASGPAAAVIIENAQRERQRLQQLAPASAATPH